MTLQSKLHIIGATLCILGAIVVAQPASAHPAEQDNNLLVNGGFEWPYNDDFRSDGGGFVAHGWNAWWYNDPGGDFDAPEFKGASIEEDASRVRDGVVAQQYFRPWARHMAGLWQRVAVPANSRTLFTVWGHAWSTFCAQPGPNTPGLDCDPRNSHYGNANPITMKIGIDPTGNSDPFAATVVWSQSISAYDHYQQFSVEADAQGEAVTVFVYSSPEWAAPVVNVYWDNAVLTASAANPPTSTVIAAPRATSDPNANRTQPTTTPTATATPPPTEEATVTSLPPTETATVTALPTRVQEGRICLSLFQDANANGLRDAEELLLAGGAISIEGPVSQTHLSASEPFCFEDLTPGQYDVVAGAPVGYHLTGPERIPVTISGGGEINLSFSAAQGQQEVQRKQANTSGNSRLLIFIGVIAGGLIAAAVGGALAFIVISRQGSGEA